MTEKPRLLILGAHPDDAEFHAGGLAARYAESGNTVKMVSVTNGGAGHHRLASAELAALRRREAAASGAVIGAEYITWDFPDAHLEATLEVREAIIREIRTFQPDLVLTHRPCDYHPDHRAVGQAVQDASYLVTVPLVLTDVPFMRRDPVVAYMVDHFTKPYAFQADVVINIESQLDTVMQMLSCHDSQVFDFLPYNRELPGDVPEGTDERLEWLKSWYCDIVSWRCDRFAKEIEAQLGAVPGQDVRYIEAYEISEYASQLAPEERARLFGL